MPTALRCSLANQSLLLQEVLDLFENEDVVFGIISAAGWKDGERHLMKSMTDRTYPYVPK